MRCRTLLPLLLAVILPPASVASSPWQEIAPPPVASAGFARGAFAEGPVIAGGNRWDGDHKLTLDEAWLYLPNENRWEPLARLPRPFAFGAFGFREDVLVLLGGDDGATTRHDGIELRRNGAAQPFPTALPPFAYAGGAVLNNRLHVLGGSGDATAPLKMHGDFRSIDTVTSQVAVLPAYAGGPIIHPAIIALGPALFSFTGARAVGDPLRLANIASAYRYDSERRSWSALPEYPFPVRGLSACVLDERHVLLAGGYRDAPAGGSPASVTDEACIFDTASSSYRPIAPLPYAGMLVGLVAHDGWVYLLGGETGPRQRATRAFRARIASLLDSPP